MGDTDVKVALVTGASRGLGRAIALGLHEAGLAVVGVSRTAVARPCDEERLASLEADISNPDLCAAVVEASVERFGRVDVLVNNAAVSHEDFPNAHETALADISIAAWRRVIDVNLNGTFFMTRAAAPAMVERGWGRIVNLSTSKESMLLPSFLPYGPSKAAVSAMTAGWARRLAGSGVTVNEVMPGGATAEAGDAKHWWPDRLGIWPPSIMVPPVRWIASTESDGVTGRRFVARLWDDTLAPAEAAAVAGAPAGWEIGDDRATPPPAA